MTLDEIKDYKDNVYDPKKDYKDDENDGEINLFGYTSCSLKKDAAMKFMWENQDSGHHKVLFHIINNYNICHYFLNAGAYDHEEEVLLMDGIRAKITSVEEVKDSEGNQILYILISL